MINQIFSRLHPHTQAWVIALIASWDNKDKIKALVKKYVGDYEWFAFYKNKTDSFFVAEFNDIVYIGHSCTRNLWAWMSNVWFFLKRGVHRGIANQMDDLFTPVIKYLVRKKKRIVIAGHSRGGANALYTNLLSREAGCKDVESYGFAHPYIMSRGTGVRRCRAMRLLHTHYDTDSLRGKVSDPIDDVGSIRGKHYGHRVQLYGTQSLLDHAPSRLNKAIAVKLLIDFSMPYDYEFLCNLDGEVITK